MITTAIRLRGVLLPREWRHAALSSVYAALTIYFLAVNLQPVWFGVSFFMTFACGIAWWARTGDSETNEARHKPLLRRYAAKLPPIYLALALPLTAAWFAGDYALGRPPQANYWPAFGLWLGAIAGFLALLIPWRSLAARPNVREALAAVPWTEVSIVALITLVALGARIVDLVDEPGPFSGDESNFANQALEVIHGTRKNMFSTGVPFGQPSIYYFLEAGFFRVLGTGVLMARLPSVLFGVSMVPILYLFLREQFDRRVALVGAAFLAVYHLHVHFSRAGLNNISAAWIAIVCLYFAARATRTQKPLDFGLTGAVAGLSLYSFVAARAVPPVLGLYFAWVVLFNWRFLRDNLGSFLILLAGFAIVAAPQGLFFIQNSSEWSLGTRWANIFANGYFGEQQAHQSRVWIMVHQFRLAFGTLAVYPEVYHHYNPNTPIVDPIRLWRHVPGPSFWFLTLGSALALYHLRQARYFVWLALLITTVILGAAVNTPPPSAARLVTMTPAVAALLAIGLVAVVDAFIRWRPHLAKAAYASAAGVVLLLVFINVQFYFGDYLPGDRYVQGDNDITFAAGAYFEELGPEYLGYWFGAPEIFTSDPTMRFVGRDRRFVDVPEGARRLPLPPAELPNTTLVFLPNRLREAEPVRQACPDGRWRELWETHDRRLLFAAYELPNGLACLRQAELLGQPPEPPKPSTEPSPTTAVERDARRRADLESIRKALEQFYDDEGHYPTSAGQWQSLCLYAEVDAGCQLTNELNPLPVDPAGDPVVNGYFYASDGRRFSVLSILEGDAAPIDPATCFFYEPTLFEDKPIKLCATGSRQSGSLPAPAAT